MDYGRYGRTLLRRVSEEGPAATVSCTFHALRALQRMLLVLRCNNRMEYVQLNPVQMSFQDVLCEVHVDSTELPMV